MLKRKLFSLSLNEYNNDDSGVAKADNLQGIKISWHRKQMLFDVANQRKSLFSATCQYHSVEGWEVLSFSDFAPTDCTRVKLVHIFTVLLSMPLIIIIIYLRRF